jgi:hypothetical protein
MRPREANLFFFDKRGLCCFVFLQASLLHLAGRGGEGMDKGGLVVLHRRRGSRLELLEIRLFTACQSRRCRRCPAAATRGLKEGHAVLVASGASFFFLLERIYLSSEAALKPPVQPSGLVPGWDWGGAAQLLQAAGGAQGSVCLEAFPARVFSAKFKGYVVIFSLFWALV